MRYTYKVWVSLVLCFVEAFLALVIFNPMAHADYPSVMARIEWSKNEDGRVLSEESTSTLHTDDVKKKKKKNLFDFNVAKIRKQRVFDSDQSAREERKDTDQRGRQVTRVERW